MKFSAGDPNLLGVLSRGNFLQMFGIVQSPVVANDAGLAPGYGTAVQSRLEQRDFIKVSGKHSFLQLKIFLLNQ